MSREKLILAFWQYGERREKKFTKWCQKNYGIIAQGKNHQKKLFKTFLCFVLLLFMNLVLANTVYMYK